MKDVKYFEQQKSDIIDTLKGAISVSPDMEAEQTIESINQVINSDGSRTIYYYPDVPIR